MLAAAIVLAMVLYLVDKNQKWGAAWAVAKWCLKALLGFVVFVTLELYVSDPVTSWVYFGVFIGIALLWEPFWTWLRNLPDGETTALIRRR